MEIVQSLKMEIYVEVCYDENIFLKSVWDAESYELDLPGIWMERYTRSAWGAESCERDLLGMRKVVNEIYLGCGKSVFWGCGKFCM